MAHIKEAVACTVPLVSKSSHRTFYLNDNLQKNVNVNFRRVSDLECKLEQKDNFELEPKKKSLTKKVTGFQVFLFSISIFIRFAILLCRRSI